MRVQLAASMGSLSTRSAGALLASNDLVAIALLPLLVLEAEYAVASS